MDLTPSASLHKNYYQLQITRYISESMFIYLLQIIGMMITLTTPCPFIWIAPGVACGFMFLKGVRIVFAIWLGTMCAYYFSYHRLFDSIIIASIFAIQPVVILYCNYYWLKNPSLIFKNYRHLIYYTVLVASVTFTGAGLLIICIYLGHPTWFMFTSIWLANLLGTLSISLIIVTWDSIAPSFINAITMRENYLKLNFTNFTNFISFIKQFSPIICLTILIISLVFIPYFGFMMADPRKTMVLQIILLLVIILSFVLSSLSYNRKW